MKDDSLDATLLLIGIPRTDSRYKAARAQLEPRFAPLARAPTAPATTTAQRRGPIAAVLRFIFGRR